MITMATLSLGFSICLYPFLVSTKVIHQDRTMRVYTTNNSSALLRYLENELLLLWMHEFPEFATFSGEHTFDDALESFTTDAFIRRKSVCESLLQQAKTIPVSALTEEEALDLKIFTQHLETYINGYRWSEYGAINPVNFLEGLIQGPQWIYNNRYVFEQDYEKYLNRLTAFSKMIKEQIRLMRKAIYLKRTNHISSMKRVPEMLRRLRYKDHLAYPLRSRLERSAIPRYKWQDIRSRGAVLLNIISVAFQTLASFIENEYIPACRKREGVYSLDGGIEYYKGCLKWYTGYNMSPQEVFNIGMSEVRRIEKNMMKVVRSIGFDGDLKSFYRSMRNIPELYNKTSRYIINRYQYIIKNEIEPRMTRLFYDIKFMPIRILPTTRAGPWALYTNNTFFVNILDISERSTITMIPFALHETIPGHHFQASYSQLQSIPVYRHNLYSGRLSSVPFNFPSYPAFIEGWALYAESLGTDMGLYNNPYNRFGKYCSEIFRASRLVIDTGIHAFGWSREMAVSFLSNYTDFPLSQIESEVDRYITWPGQATAYKIGEMKLQELRKASETYLGKEFDIKEFHHEILRRGVVSLDILQDVIKHWLARKKRVKTPPQAAITSLDEHNSLSTAASTNNVLILFLAISCVATQKLLLRSSDYLLFYNKII